MVWKVVNIADTGTAIKFGADDTDKINKGFSGTDVDDYDINSDWKFRSSKMSIANPANTFSYLFAGDAIGGNRTITLPLLTGSDVLVTKDFAQTLTNKTISGASNTISNIPDSALSANVAREDISNDFGNFDNSFYNSRLRIWNPAHTFRTNIVSAAIAANRNLTIPLLTGDDTIAVLGLAQDWGDVDQSFRDNRVRIWNPADTFRYRFIASAITANRDITLPLASGNWTLPFFVQSGATNDINNTAVETDMLNYSVVGNQLGANGCVRFTITGYILQNDATGRTYTFTVKFGTTNMWADATGSFAQSATKIPFRIQGEVFNKNATNAQGANIFLIINDTGAATTGIGDLATAGTVETVADSEGADTTKDTTSAQTLQVTTTMSGTGSVNVHTVVKHTLVEVYPAA